MNNPTKDEYEKIMTIQIFAVGVTVGSALISIILGDIWFAMTYIILGTLMIDTRMRYEQKWEQLQYEKDKMADYGTLMK
jgi:hypothetical protein